jgi:hypothetical protein
MSHNPQAPTEFMFNGTPVKVITLDDLFAVQDSNRRISEENSQTLGESSKNPEWLVRLLENLHEAGTIDSPSNYNLEDIEVIGMGDWIPPVDTTNMLNDIEAWKSKLNSGASYAPKEERIRDVATKYETAFANSSLTEHLDVLNAAISSQFANPETAIVYAKDAKVALKDSDVSVNSGENSDETIEYVVEVHFDGKGILKHESEELADALKFSRIIKDSAQTSQVSVKLYEKRTKTVVQTFSIPN